MKKTVLAIIFLTCSQFLYSQCVDGESAVSLNIVTDPWPYETYWEIVPTGNGCGNGTIASGSNLAVGCSGADGGADTSYPANTLMFEGPFCLVIGESYDLIFVDSYGDGGLSFQLNEDGNQAFNFYASGFGNTWTFEVGSSNLQLNDSPCGATEVVPNGGVVELNNTTAVSSFIEPAAPAGACGASGYWCEGGLSNTVWAYFIAEEGITYEVTTCNSEGSFDTQIAVYHADNCADYSTFQSVGANDDYIYGCGLTDNFASTCWVSCLVPGDTYYVQIDGWNGITGTTHLSVSAYEGNVEMLEVLNDVACPLDKGQTPNGSIQPFLIGEGSDFSCEWTGSNNFFSTENSVYNLAPGTYDLVLTTPCGTVFTDTYEIFQPTPWNVSVVSVDPDCTASADGSISVEVSGATEPYTFTWTGFDFNSSEQEVTELNSGTYNLTITDNNGCNYPQTFVLEPADEFSFDLGDDTTICSTDELLVFAPAGLVYLWQDGSTNQFYQINAEDWNIGSNALILSAETEEGCSYTDAFVFEVDDCSGVEDIEGTSSFQIYPNPSDDQFTISSATYLHNANLQIYDSTGRIVYVSNNLNGSQISISTDLPSGFYTVIINSDNWSMKKPLIRR
ncbi:MAG: T9SS type A sorting domain-containing protein [Flavobacteriales bacterium]